MAVQRTKKHKLKQMEKIEKESYSLPVSTKRDLKLVKDSPKSINDQQMFSYSLDFIRQDLVRTSVVTLVVLIVLAVIVYLDLR